MFKLWSNTGNRGIRILARGSRKTSFLLGILGTILLLSAWFFVSWFGWIKPLYLPPPWRIVQAAFDIKPHILVHTLYTAGLVSLGLSLIPFFILWFGFSWVGKLVLVSLGSFLIVVVGVMNSIDGVDPVFLRTALSFGGNNWKFLRYAAFWAIMPSMLAPLRIALAFAITVTVISEYMGATRGLGHVMNIALSNFSSHTILLCAFILGIMGLIMDCGLRLIHRSMTMWAKTAEEAVEEPVSGQMEVCHES
ncbi:hypothetical protein ES703_27542 [subsurface metagenome]